MKEAIISILLWVAIAIVAMAALDKWPKTPAQFFLFVFLVIIFVGAQGIISHIRRR